MQPGLQARAVSTQAGNQRLRQETQSMLVKHKLLDFSMILDAKKISHQQKISITESRILQSISR